VFKLSKNLAWPLLPIRKIYGGSYIKKVLPPKLPNIFANTKIEVEILGIDKKIRARRRTAAQRLPFTSDHDNVPEHMNKFQEREER
jgi:hypothetical protein